MTTVPSLDPLVFRAHALPISAVARWHASAPRKVRQASQWDESSQGWVAWRKHLAHRKQPRPVRELFEGLDLESEASLEVSSDALPSWSNDAEHCLWSDDSAGATLEFARSLPRAVESMSAEMWWSSLGKLLALTQSAAAAPMLDAPLEWQWVACELALTLAYEFPELEACRALGPRAVERLSTAMNELLDGDGLVHARYLGQYRQLVACWSRMRLLCAAVDELPWSAEMTEQADRAVVHLLRLTRADGSQALGPTGRDHAPEPKWFTAIARSTGNRSIVRLARAVAGAKVDLPSEKRVGAAANDSEWAELAILRSDWTRQAARLTVAYVDRCARSELAIGKHLLFCGESTISLRQNDRSCTMESDWEQVCWETNDDCDYLELEAEFSGGIKVQRQMMLARHDQIAYLADAIVCAEPGDLSYETSFPLSPKLEFQPAIESNEAQLGDHKPRALVLPIALPEWRSATRNGSLVADEHVLRFHHSAAQVRGLYAPMFIDLKPKRFAQQFTWRRLTVAEDRSVVPADVAAGFRVHIGNRQWLVYRSLHPGGSRTVLGHHLYSEFVLGQFTSDGTIDPLIEIE